MGHPALEPSQAGSLWRAPLLFGLLLGSAALETLPLFDQKKDSERPCPFLSWGGCTEPGISLETPWLRAIWKTINLQGCTKHPEA